MKPIQKGDKGAAVEDIQGRLSSLGYDVSNDMPNKIFGEQTAKAVSMFRVDQELPSGETVDKDTWSKLVDETFSLGDRSIYLRFPNFHGNDVKELQHALSVLGFSCGYRDGIFGVHTEAALKEFQMNIGVYPDGIAHDETFRAINRLEHVWSEKDVSEDGSMHVGFARAVDVLEHLDVALVGTSPISRTVASRMWNIATATSEQSGVQLFNVLEDVPSDIAVILLLTTEEVGDSSNPTIFYQSDGSTTSKLQTAYKSLKENNKRIVKIQILDESSQNEPFTAYDAQSIAIDLIDALCNMTPIDCKL